MKPIRAWLLAAFWLLAPWPAAAFHWRDPLAARNRQGNQLAQNGQYAQALDQYKEAQVESPECPQLHYNIGVALAQQAKFDEAIQSFNNIGASAEALKAQAHYNVGVCQFRQALQASEAGDFQKALDLLQACMDSNRQTLKLRPDDNDAKYNFEQAKRAWKELFDKLKQQQQQNPQQNEKQGQQDQQQQQQENGQSQDQQRQQQQQQGQQQEGEKQDQQGAQPTPTPAPASAPQASKDQTAQSKPSEQGQQQQQGQGELTEEQARRILNRLGEENAKAFMELMRPPGMPVQRWQNDW